MTKRRIAIPALLVALLMLIMIGNVLMLRLDDSFVDAYIAEDGPAEWAGAICLLAGAVLAVLAFFRVRRRSDGSWQARIKALSCLGVALILFVACGEEISWGQRLLGLETPDAIREINSQEEINFHNLYGDASGQNLSTRVFQAFWVGWAVLIPLLALVPRVRRLLGRLVVILPIWLTILFVGQQLLWDPIRANWRSDPAAWNGEYRPDIGGEGPYRVETLAEAEERGVTGPAGLGEVMEANVQLLLFVGALCMYLRARAATAPTRTGRSTATAAPPRRVPA